MPNTSRSGDIWASGIVTNYEAACLPENARGWTGKLICQLCKKAPESVAQVLAGNKYMTRDNEVLKILFFEILQDLGLVDSVPPWCSPLKPKPVYEANNAQEFWDVPLFAEHQEVRAYRLSGCSHSSPEILDISSPLTKSAVFHIPKKIKHGGCEDSNGKEADFVRNFTQFKLCWEKIMTDLLLLLHVSLWLRRCDMCVQSFALTSMSLSDFPLLYDMIGGIL